MAKILLLEDDERQIQWARKSLVDHVLTVYTEGGDIQDLIHNHKPDFVIIDLHLPLAHYEPRISYAMDAFYVALETLIASDESVNGVALVGNYEHHVDWSEPSSDRLSIIEAGYLINTSRIIEAIGKRVKGADIRNLHFTSNTNSPLNLLFWYDVSLRLYSHYMTEDGTIINIERRSNEAVNDIVRDIRKGKYVNLKPYPFIVKSLEEGMEN